MVEIKHNFLGIPDIPLKKAHFVVLPIPFEATTSCQTGTKEGPTSIIYSSNYVELYDEELDFEPYTYGIKTLLPVEPDYKSLKGMVSKIEKSTLSYVKEQKVVIGLGGEHTISLGLVRAYLKYYPDIKVICLDAHADLRDEYQGTRFSHACVMRRISELGCPVFSAGVRSISKEEMELLNKNSNIRTLFAHEMYGKKWIDILNQALPSGTYYLSFDVDFLDPLVLPDTGTPEPGGFFWYDTVEFLRTFIQRKDIKLIGLDIVELSSSKLFTPSSFIVAKLIYKMIGFLGEKYKSTG
ncbi:MAG: agmatinase [Candidatus Omnitrophica bacterium]|nr:agmatinase [Candidatus Omnitrophota bacterium]